MEIKRGKSIGLKTIEVLEYGGQRTKKIKRIVYSKPTLAKGHPSYWFELRKGIWKNTTREGIKHGIVASRTDFKKLGETGTSVETSVKKTSLKKEALAYLKKQGYTGIISGEFLAKKRKIRSNT